MLFNIINDSSSTILMVVQISWKRISCCILCNSYMAWSVVFVEEWRYFLSIFNRPIVLALWIPLNPFHPLWKYAHSSPWFSFLSIITQTVRPGSLPSTPSLSFSYCIRPNEFVINLIYHVQSRLYKLYYNYYKIVKEMRKLWDLYNLQTKSENFRKKRVVFL